MCKNRGWLLTERRHLLARHALIVFHGRVRMAGCVMPFGPCAHSDAVPCFMSYYLSHRYFTRLTLFTTLTLHDSAYLCIDLGMTYLCIDLGMKTNVCPIFQRISNTGHSFCLRANRSSPGGLCSGRQP